MTEETNKGGRPLSEDGPKDGFFAFRGPAALMARFRAIAGRDRGRVLLKLLAWWLGEDGAELPERPCDARKAA